MCVSCVVQRGHVLLLPLFVYSRKLVDIVLTNIVSYEHLRGRGRSTAGALAAIFDIKKATVPFVSADV